MIVTKNLVLFVTLGSLVALVIKARPILLQPYLWILIAWGGYIVCTSGFVYLLISPMPVFRMDTDQYGKQYIKEYIYRSSRG